MKFATFTAVASVLTARFRNGRYRGGGSLVFMVVVVATLQVFTHPTHAEDEPVIHQTLFTNDNVSDGTSEKLVLSCESVWRSIRKGESNEKEDSTN